MPTNRRTLRIEVDSHSVRETMANIVQAIWQKPGVQTAAQLAAFGGTIYGGARLLGSGPAQAAGNFIGSAGDHLRSAAGFSPIDDPRAMRGNLLYPTLSSRLMGRPEGYTGRNLLPTEAIYYGYRDFGQRVGAGIGAFGGITLPTLAAFGVMNTGLLSGVSSLTGAAGRAIGGGVASGTVGVAGRVAGGILGRFGLTGARDAVLAATGPSSLIAQGGAKAMGIVGGFAGSMLPLSLLFSGAARVGEAVVENITTQRQIEDWMDQTGYKYTYGNASNLIRGKGFDYSTQKDIAEYVRETLAQQNLMRQTDFQEIFRGIQMSDLDFNVRSAKEFKEKFAKVTEVLVDIARSFETTLEGAVHMLGTMQKSGFYTTADQAAMLWRNNALARASGVESEEMVEQSLSGAESAQRYGLPKSYGSLLQTSIYSRIRRAPTGMGETERAEYERMMQDLGGEEAVAGMLTDFMLQASVQDPNMTNVLYALVDLETGEIDTEMMRKFRNKEMSLVDLIHEGTRKAAESQEAFEAFQQNKQLYFGKLHEQDAIDFTTGMVDYYMDTLDLTDRRSALEYMGMDNPLLRFVADLGLFSPNMRSEVSLQFDEVARTTMQQQAFERTFMGWLEKNVSKPLSQFFQQLGGAGIPSWIMQQLENFQTEWIFKVDKVEILPSDLSLEKIREANELLRVGELVGDYVPTQIDTTKIVENILASIQASIDSQVEIGGDVTELAASRERVEELRTTFLKLFEDLSNGKITVQQFSQAYIDAMRELIAVANEQEIAVDSAVETMMERILKINELAEENPEIVNTSYKLAQDVEEASVQRWSVDLSRQDPLRSDNAVIAATIQNAAKIQLSKGTTPSEFLMSNMLIPALTEEEEEELDRVFRDDAIVQGFEKEEEIQEFIQRSKMAMGVLPITPDSLTEEELVLLDKIYQDPQMREDFANIRNLEDGIHSKQVVDFVNKHGYEYYNLFKAFERLHEEGVFTFSDRFSRHSANKSFFDLTAFFQEDRWTMADTFYPTSEQVMEKREVYAEHIAEGVKELGYDEEVQKAFKGFLLDPYNSSKIGPVGDGYSIIEDGLKTKEFIEMLKEVGVTDKEEQLQLVELYVKSLMAGAGKVYPKFKGFDADPTAVALQKSLDELAGEWLLGLEETTNTNLHRRNAISGGHFTDEQIGKLMRDVDAIEVLLDVLDAIGEEGEVDGFKMRQAELKAGDDTDLWVLADALVRDVLRDPEKKEGHKDLLLLMSSMGNMVGRQGISDVLRQTLTTRAETFDFLGQNTLNEQYFNAARSLREFASKAEKLDLSSLYNEDVIAAFQQIGETRVAGIIKEGATASLAMQSVEAGGADFETTRQSIIESLLTGQFIGEEEVEKFGLRTVQTSEDFKNLIDDIFAQLFASQFAEPGSHPIFKDFDTGRFIENMEDLTLVTSGVIVENSSAITDLKSTMDLHKTTMDELKTVLRELQKTLMK